MSELDKSVVKELDKAFHEAGNQPEPPDHTRITRALCVALAEIRDELKKSNASLARIQGSVEKPEMER